MGDGSITLGPQGGLARGMSNDFTSKPSNGCLSRITTAVSKRITKKRTKNKAKTTKPDTEWKSCEGQSQIKAKDQKSQSQSQLNKLTVKTGASERISTASPSVSTIGLSINTASENINTGSPNINTASPIPNDSSIQSLENTSIFDDAYDDREVGAEADLNNLETTMNVSPIPTTRIHKDHPIDQIIGDINSTTQTRRMTKIFKEHAMVSYIKKHRRKNHNDYQNCLFVCFLSQIKPKKVIQDLTDPSWIEAMQEELLQFKLQKVWNLVDLPKGKRAIGTKWVYRNKKYERGIIDVKSAFLYGTIEEEVYVCQPLGFEDPCALMKVYEGREKCFYGLHTKLLEPDSPFDLEAFSDSDYAGASLDRKSTTGDEAIHKEWGDRMKRTATTASSFEAEQDSVNTLRSGEDSMKLMELMEHCTTLSELFWATKKVKTVNGERQLQALVDKKKVIIIETSIRSDLKLEDAGGTDCFNIPCSATSDVQANLEEGVVDSDIPIDFSIDTYYFLTISSKHQRRMSKEKTEETIVLRQSLWLEDKVKSFGKETEVQETSGFKRLRKVRSASRVENPSNDAQLHEMNDDNLMFDTDVLEEQEKDVAKKEVSAVDPVTTAGEVVTTANVEVTTFNAPTTTIDELTLAQTLRGCSSAPCEFKTTSSSLQASQIPHAKDKCKGIMVEPEVPLKKKDQVALDEEMARNLEAQLQVELIEEERISRQKE
ncbi:hypothetical protein Tco_0026690 [Tanacetum coccineum]